MPYIYKISVALLLICCGFSSPAQKQYELNAGWRAIRATTLPHSVKVISSIDSLLTDWLPAVVPGTVLGTLLGNKLIPDPFYGMNNDNIPDIYKAGRDYYTYWFVNDFNEPFPEPNEHTWIQFRGINYSYDCYINGHKLNHEREKSMFLRHQYDITQWLSKTGRNRLAVIVYPPDYVGNPNGGQGGDGTIARNLTNQFTAGWDWIQPVHDRNTGIWDKVFIKKNKGGTSG